MVAKVKRGIAASKDFSLFNFLKFWECARMENFGVRDVDLKSLIKYIYVNCNFNFSV